MRSIRHGCRMDLMLENAICPAAVEISQAIHGGLLVIWPAIKPLCTIKQPKIRFPL